MITVEQQIAIIDHQINEWEEAAFNAEIAHTVHTRLKTNRLPEFEHNLAQAEIAIVELQKLRAQLVPAPTGAQQEG